MGRRCPCVQPRVRVEGSVPPVIRVSSAFTDSIGDVRSTTTNSIAGVADWKLSLTALSPCAVGDAEQYLRRVAGAGSELLRQREGRIDALVDAVGPSVFVPVMFRVFGHDLVVEKFPQIQRLLRVLSPGAPVDSAPGGCLEAEVAYGNHPSTPAHTTAVTEKLIS